MSADVALLIAGSRDFPRLTWVDRYVALLPDGTTVIAGGARGVDRRAAVAARARGLAVEEHPADWAGHGRGAGYLRNAEMVQRADAVAVFWDGASRGSAHTIALARGVKPLLVVYADGTIRETARIDGAHPCPLTRAELGLDP